MVTPTKRQRGRPAKPDALSNAERQARFRARRAAELAQLRQLATTPAATVEGPKSPGVAKVKASRLPNAKIVQRIRPSMLVAIAGAKAAGDLEVMLDLARQLMAEHTEAERVRTMEGRLHASDIALLQRNLEDPDLRSLQRAFAFILEGHTQKA